MDPENPQTRGARPARCGGLGVDHKTVGAARDELEATGEIPQLDRTIGADGKSRPIGYRLIDDSDAGKNAVIARVKEIRQENAQQKRDQNAELAARPVVLPTGQFETVIIDPPWPMERIRRDVAPNEVGFDYPTMTEDQLREFRIPAADDCHLFLWTTQKFTPMAHRLLEHWGFRYVFHMVWHKPGGFQPFGLPQYPASVRGRMRGPACRGTEHKARRTAANCQCPLTTE
jgi:hypothetical protein